jgi:hypothetical protein
MAFSPAINLGNKDDGIILFPGQQTVSYNLKKGGREMHARAFLNGQNRIKWADFTSAQVILLISVQITSR